jgi:hypothetical protein
MTQNGIDAGGDEIVTTSQTFANPYDIEKEIYDKDGAGAPELAETKELRSAPTFRTDRTLILTNFD